MNKRLETVLNISVTLAAVVLVGLFVRREIVAATQESASAGGPPDPVYLADWNKAQLAGREIADSSSPVKLIVFLDLECPACRVFHTGSLA